MTGMLETPARLSKEEIVAAAYDLISEVGVQNLTMRALADRLGVTQGAAYRHLPGKAAILEEISESVFSDIELPLEADGDWSTRLQAAASMIYDAFAGLPGLGSYVLSLSAFPKSSERFRDWILEVMRTSGFDEVDSKRVLGVFSVVAVGALTLDPARAPVGHAAGTSRRKDVSDRRARRLAIVEARRVFADALGLIADGLRAELSDAP